MRKVRNDLTRRTSDSGALDSQESSSPRDVSKSPGRRRKFSLGSARNRSVSLDNEREGFPGHHLGSMPLPTVRKDSLSSDHKKKDPKTFSMTLFVNESEKNKIVDLLHKAKSLISKKVEKVMGKKPKANMSNVDALQTVLESWMDREQEEEKEDKKLFESLMKQQEIQAASLAKSGLKPVTSLPTLAVEEEIDSEDSSDDDDTIEEEPESDLEVSRLTFPRYLRPPDIRRSRNVSDNIHSARSLSPMDNVPCPFGNRPESELYGPKLRRPSSHYGAGAAAACSRPASRQVSVSPSVALMPETVINAAEDYEEEEETAVRYCRPDSFIIPIGGVWRPGDDSLESEVKWGKVATDEEYLAELRKEQEQSEEQPEEEGDSKDEPLTCFLVVFEQHDSPYLHQFLRH